MGEVSLKFGPKVIYFKLIALRHYILRQYFEDLGPKYNYLNEDLGTLKPSKVVNRVQYKNLMVFMIFKIRPNCPNFWSQGNLSQAYGLKALYIKAVF